MSLESGTYINDLVATNPLAGDNRSEGDDHIRLLKAVLKATFPNLSGAVTPTHTEMNFVDGVTSSIQTQLNTLTSSKASMPAGTVCLFYQAAAPTGWTQIVTQNNKALRIVSGTGGGTGGSVAFTTAFANKSVTGTVGSHILTINEMPSHNHSYAIGEGTSGTAMPDLSPNDGNNQTQTAQTNWTGGGAGHDHTFTGTAINLAVQYIDVIMASRN